MFPIYGALHVVPMILFKWKTFFDHPVRMLVKAMGGTMRSSAFLGVFVVIYQSASSSTLPFTRIRCCFA
jgi:hypothetical protein